MVGPQVLTKTGKDLTFLSGVQKQAFMIILKGTVWRAPKNPSTVGPYNNQIITI